MNLDMIRTSAGFRSLTKSVVRRAFEDVEMWPMDFRFLDRFVKEREDEKESCCTSNNLTRPKMAVRNIKKAVISGASMMLCCSKLMQHLVIRLAMRLRVRKRLHRNSLQRQPLLCRTRTIALVKHCDLASQQYITHMGNCSRKKAPAQQKEAEQERESQTRIGAQEAY